MFGNSESKIQKLAEKKNAEKIIPFLRDKNPATRLAALDGLGACGNVDAYNALLPFVRDSDPTTREHAIRALGALGDGNARTHIMYQRGKEDNPAVKQAIEDALKRINATQV